MKIMPPPLSVGMDMNSWKAWFQKLYTGLAVDDHLEVGDTVDQAWAVGYKTLSMGKVTLYENSAGTALGLVYNGYFNGTNWIAIAAGSVQVITFNSATGAWNVYTSAAVAAGAVATLAAVVSSDINSNLTIAGYSTLGTGGPSIKMKKLTGTTGAVGVNVSTAHGLTLAKILDVQVLVLGAGGAKVAPNRAPGTVSAYLVSVDATNVNILVDAAGTNVASQAFTALITYEA